MRTHGEIKRCGTCNVPMAQIKPNPLQPRVNFDESKLNELAESIAVHGLLQPIAVRKIGNEEFMIIAGERRWRAHRINKATEIRAEVLECDDRTAYEFSLLENLQREDIDLLEEARGYQHLKDEFGYTGEELAKVVQKSPSSISNIMGIFKEDKRVQAYVASGVLTLAALVWIKQLPNVREKLELLGKLEREEVKRTDVKEYVRRIVKAYKVAAELGIDPAELLRQERAGKPGRFDVKSEEIIPEDFRFFFITDQAFDEEGLKWIPKARILVSAFEYLHNKGSAKHLAQLLFNRDRILTLMADSGVVPACKKERWDFFEKTDQLLQWYESVEPDICVALDIPAYPPVLNKWGLTVEQIIEGTVKNAVKFRDWEPKWDCTKMYPIQGTIGAEYLDCFKRLDGAGCFEGQKKIAVAFGSIARRPLEEIIWSLQPTLEDPRFIDLRERFEFVHGFGIGQAQRIVKLYELGVNSFDALTCTIVTATGQYLLRDEKYYFHIVHENPLVRRLRMYMNVNSFWGCLTQRFAEMKGLDKISDAERKGVDRSIEKLGTQFEGEG